MKYTKEERLDISRRIFIQEISYKEAMEIYDLSESAAHKYLTDYKRANGIPVRNQSPPKQSHQNKLPLLIRI